MFEKLSLNPYVKNALKQYMDKGQKNAQHLILSGPQGTGKRTCADILAHFLLDIRLDKPLHSCADFFCLDCDQASIKLSDTEDLREFISYSSTVRRVVLIDNANQMTPNVANSLLKELEDGQCVFIFIAHKPLIRTVCSRCFEIRFLPVNEDDMAQFFMEQTGSRQPSGRDLPAIPSRRSQRPSSVNIFLKLRQNFKSVFSRKLQN